MLSGGVNTNVASGDSSNFETVHTSNAAILNRLGLAPLQIPDGHHKKRLAGPEPLGLFNSQMRIHQPYSRRHGHHRDSHVYIVKLPASPSYYTVTKPHRSIKDDKMVKIGPSFPVGFQGNGKPAKIYHWNLPVVKKITEKKRLQNQLRIQQAKKKLEDFKKWQQLSTTKTILNKLYSFDISRNSHDIDNRLFSQLPQKLPTTKHVRNNDKRLSYPDNKQGNFQFESPKKSDSSNKAYKLDDTGMHRIHLTNELYVSRNTTPKMKKHQKKAAMSYYAPITTKMGSTSIHKNFPGNGKPKAFYVMEKSRKPIYYHPLLP